MSPINIIFYGHALIGLILILFSKRITHFTYSLTLYFTGKLNLDKVFLFKIDDSNRNSMFFLMRSFTIMFGIFILAGSLYMLNL